MELFYLIIFVVIGSIIVIGILLQFANFFKDLFRPLETFEAQIIEIDTRRASQFRNGRINVTPVYGVTFSILDGVKKELDISAIQYEWVKVGDVGTLKIQGKSFVNFKKQTNV